MHLCSSLMALTATRGRPLLRGRVGGPAPVPFAIHFIQRSRVLSHQTPQTVDPQQQQQQPEDPQQQPQPANPQQQQQQQPQQAAVAAQTSSVIPIFPDDNDMEYSKLGLDDFELRLCAKIDGAVAQLKQASAQLESKSSSKIDAAVLQLKQERAQLKQELKQQSAQLESKLSSKVDAAINGVLLWLLPPVAFMIGLLWPINLHISRLAPLIRSLPLPESSSVGFALCLGCIAYLAVLAWQLSM